MATAAELNFYFRMFHKGGPDKRYWQELIAAHNLAVAMGQPDPNEGWLIEAMFGEGYLGNTERRRNQNRIIAEYKADLARREGNELLEEEAEELASYNPALHGPIHLKKEKNMARSTNEITFNVADILRKEMEAQQFNSDLEKGRQRMLTFGLKDVWPDGTVVTFVKPFNVANNSKAELEKRDLRFVAIKIDGTWHMTGPDGTQTPSAGWQWVDFVLWLISGDFPLEADDVQIIEYTGRTMRVQQELTDKVVNIEPDPNLSAKQ